MTKSAEYNPLAREVLEDPFPAYSAMREACPVHRFSAHEPPFYTAFRYLDVVEIVMNRDDWTARYGISPQFQRGVGFNTDGAQHVKFRRAVLSGLTPQNIAALTPEITSLVEKLVLGSAPHSSEAETTHSARGRSLPMSDRSV